MSEVKVLIEGYARKTKSGWLASSSTTLIKDSGLNVIADPGSNKRLLIKRLAAEHLKLGDIDLIFVTHYHIDHLLNIRLFPNCDVMDGDEINRDDRISEYSGNIPGTRIKVIPTPGHAHEHASLIVRTKKGNVAIAGDLWWWRVGEEQRTDYNSLMEKEDSYVKNKNEIRSSRKKILENADYIIPGHGKTFEVKSRSSNKG